MIDDLPKGLQDMVAYAAHVYFRAVPPDLAAEARRWIQSRQDDAEFDRLRAEHRAAVDDLVRRLPAHETDVDVKVAIAAAPIEVVALTFDRIMSLPRLFRAPPLPPRKTTTPEAFFEEWLIREWGALLDLPTPM